MTKKVKNLIKKIGRSYMKGVLELYGPALKYGVSPFI